MISLLVFIGNLLCTSAMLVNRDIKWMINSLLKAAYTLMRLDIWDQYMNTELQDSSSQTWAILTPLRDYVLLWHLGYCDGWAAGMLLVSNMYRPGILLNILWCARWTPTTKNYPSENVSNAKIEKPQFKLHILALVIF